MFSCMAVWMDWYLAFWLDSLEDSQVWLVLRFSPIYTLQGIKSYIYDLFKQVLYGIRKGGGKFNFLKGS